MIENQKIFFGSNLAYLRVRKKLTQVELANTLGIKRTGLRSYELEHTLNPPLELLLKVAAFFEISTDTFLKIDLSKLSELQLRQLEAGNDVYIKGGKLRILATTVDNKNQDNIELVNHKAKAGYTAGFADLEYIRELPTLHLPFLSKQRKYRAFQIEGDSMHPIPHGAIVIGEYVANWQDIKDGQAYIIVTKAEGVLFKIVNNQIKKNKTLLLSSLNTAFASYEIQIGEVTEIWHFVNYISNSMPEQLSTNEQILLRLTGLESKLFIKGSR